MLILQIKDMAITKSKETSWIYSVPILIFMLLIEKQGVFMFVVY